MKIIKLLLKLFVSLGLGAAIYFTSTPDALIRNQEFLVNISFIVFGFMLTLFSLLIIPIRKISMIKGKESTIPFINSLSNNLKFSFFQTISIITLNYLININGSLPNFLLIICNILILSLFILLIFVIFDTMKSFFLIIQVEATGVNDEKNN